MSNTHSTQSEPTSGDAGVDLVDPRAPRFGQSITASALLAGVALGEPAFVFAIATILGISLASRWQFDLYGILWRNIMTSVVGSPAEREPASPHRFAKLLGATGSILASALLVAGFSTVGYTVAALVGLAAALAAITGICLGCRMYSQVAFFRRLDVI